MKYLLCFTILFITYSVSIAQYKVVFKLGKYPLKHNKDSIFIAGNFNGWNEHSSGFGLSPNNENGFEITTQLPEGDYEFKCTRGNWKRVETDATGKDISNREFEISSDTTIDINIDGWKDDFGAISKKHTASKQVHIMDTAFFIPQLNRTRKIWMYLPEGYAKSKKQYPVLYMQDGQNLFDAATSAYGEWGIDECLDSLIKSGSPACIVVGIENGPQRLNEYNPYEFQNFGKGEANEYVSFLTEVLKPFIDKKYQTLSDKENTMIAGSSMGALVSYYAALVQPNVFSKVGVFSPAFWTAPAIKQATDSLAKNVGGRVFFYIGGKEGEEFVNDMQNVQEMLGEKSSALIYSVTDPAGQHNEKAWRKWFPEFYYWITSTGYLRTINIDE